MPNITQLSELLVERYINFIEHLLELKTASAEDQIVFNPELFPLTDYLYNELFTLSQRDYIKMNIFLGFKIQMHSTLSTYTTQAEIRQNWLGVGLFELMRSLDYRYGLKGHGPFELGVMQYPIKGVCDYTLFYCKAFYNWYAHNRNSEEVILRYRESLAIDHGQDTLLTLLKLSKRRDVNIIDNAIVLNLTETGEIINFAIDKFYIVTESTANCKIAKVERYDLIKHKDIEKSGGLVGWVFKFTEVFNGSNLYFLTNNLHTSEFPYSIKLLGLENVN